MEVLFNLPTIYYIICFNFLFIAWLLLLLALEIRVTYIGTVICSLQIVVIVVAIINRALGPGFSLLFFLYIVALPPIIRLIGIFFKKRNKNRQTFLKTLGFRFFSHLNASFFNVFFSCNGFYYLSRRIFPLLGKNFRDLDSTKILVKFLVLPWTFLIVIIIFESFYFKNIYAGAIIFSLNLLFQRILNLVLTINCYVANYGLKFIDAQTFYSKLFPTNDTLFIFFQNPQNIDLLLDYKENNQEYVIQKFFPVYSSIKYSNSYFFSYAVKTYLIPYLNSVLNFITVLVVLIILLLHKEYAQVDLIIEVLMGVIFILASNFILWKIKFVQIKNLFKQQLDLNQTLISYRQNLIDNFYLPQTIVNMPLILPPNPKPRNFKDFFTLTEIRDPYAGKVRTAYQIPKILVFFLKNHILLHETVYLRSLLLLWFLFIILIAY